MNRALLETVATPEFQRYGNVIILQKPPVLAYENYEKFLSEIRSYCDGYWKWLHRRIVEVFVISDLANPYSGRIDKIRIKRKKGSFIDLEDGGRRGSRHRAAMSFDLSTGRYIYGGQKYIFPVEDRRAWEAWEPQSLRRRVESAMPRLPFAFVQEYADVLDPEYRRMFEPFGHFDLFGGFAQRSAVSLSEIEQQTLASRRGSAKERILKRLPGAVVELRALAEMMEGDAK